MKNLTRNLNQTIAHREGYILVPVVVMLALVAAAVYATTLQGSVGIESTVRAREARQAILVAQSGIEHAVYEATQANCTNYALPLTAFGPHTYDATFTPTSGSPVSIAATSTLASGLTRTLVRESAPIYEPGTLELFLQPGAEGKDTSFVASKPADNHGTDQVLDIKPAGSGHALLEFDLTGLPPNAVVRSATLEIYLLGGFVTTIEVHRMTRGWVEGTCVGLGSCTADGATWNSYDGTVAWTTAGGDYDPVAAAQSDATASNAWSEFDVSALASAWHEGVPNLGLLLQTTAEWLEFASSDYADESKRPKLTVEYACECDPNPSSGTVVIQPGPGLGKDVLIRASGGADKNFGANVALWVDDGAPYHSLLQFDLANLPANAFVTDAVLALYVDGFDLLPNGDVDVNLMTSAWAEGSSADPADGASWIASDGVNPWTSDGGDFDPDALDSVSMNFLGAGWYEWDVTSAVSDWKQGIVPNYGLALTPGGGSLNKVHLLSSDDLSANLRPKLTVTYTCPCGSVCQPPVAVGGDLLMVVVDPANLTIQETNKKALIEAWEFTVSLIDESVPHADFDAAMTQNDVVFVSEDVTATSVGDKLSAAAIGVVTEEDNLAHDLGLAESIVWTSGTQLNIRDISHYITSPFSLGNLTILTTSESLAYVAGGVSAELLELGNMASGFAGPALVALDPGTERWDELASVDGRRVQLPWGGDNFDLVSLNDDGRVLFRRALEWAATTPSAPGGYLDRFAAPTCDPAIDLTNSDGAFDWSGSPWTDAEDGTFCNGNAKIQHVDYNYRLMLSETAVVSRPLSLSGFDFGTVRFSYKTEGPFDSTHYVAAEMSDDGGTNWTEIGRIESESTAAATTIEFAVTTGLTADSMIRFRAEGLGMTRKLWLDNVTIVNEELFVPFVCSTYYRDSVTDTVFTGDDGTLHWATDWLEINESDGANKGDVRATSLDGGFVFQIKDNDGGGEGVEREADLSATTSATLTLLYRRKDFDDADDYVSIGASSDGGANWTELGTIGGGGSDAEFIEVSYPLDDHLSANTRIRFLSSPDLGDKDKMYIDEVEICLDTGPAVVP